MFFPENRYPLFGIMREPRSLCCRALSYELTFDDGYAANAAIQCVQYAHGVLDSREVGRAPPRRQSRFRMQPGHDALDILPEVAEVASGLRARGTAPSNLRMRKTA
jgi:hypothetical protein